MFRRGDWVLLLEVGGRYRAVARAGGRIQTIRGHLDLEPLVGAPHGSVVRSSLGVSFKALPASIYDVISARFKLGAQAIYPKDAVYIVMEARVGPGSVVAEAGTGSGFLTAVLAWFVRPTGLVRTFERRPDFARIAMSNIRAVGLEPYVDLQVRDVAASGFGSFKADAVVLDMGSPWEAVPHAREILRPGGSIVVFSTTVEHLLKSLEGLRSEGFVDISVSEVLVRRWRPEPGEVRPDTTAVVHTGWIVAARLA